VTGAVPGAGYRLAACAEMLFVDRPFLERVRRIADAGFLVEIWDWASKDIEALAASGATIVSMTGYVTGNLTQPDGAAQLLAGAARSVAGSPGFGGCLRLGLLVRLAGGRAGGALAGR